MFSLKIRPNNTTRNNIAPGMLFRRGVKYKNTQGLSFSFLVRFLKSQAGGFDLEGSAKNAGQNVLHMGGCKNRSKMQHFFYNSRTNSLKKANFKAEKQVKIK